jgi:hypothetical protein
MIWQESDIWSQASYRYPISWEAFLDPSDSYFLFADLVGFSYTLNIYAHFSSHFSQQLLMAKVPIWSLWPNIRFLSSIVVEKNVMKNVHICSICIKTNYVGKQEAGIWRIQKRYPQYGHIFHHIFLSNYWWQKSDIWSQASYRYPILWKAFLDPLDSYFLFAEEQGYHKWALAHSSSEVVINPTTIQSRTQRPLQIQ